MKKRLALITLHSVKNYGSILQTYATQCYFEQLGYDVEVIDYRRKWETPIGYWTHLNDKSLKGLVKNIILFPSKIFQAIRFNKFLHKNIKLSSNLYINKEDLIKNPINADVFCTGSDQVWNSGWNNGVIEEYFLNFVKKDKNTKKISFASSFGASTLTKNDKTIIKPYLEEYDLITVREKNSVNMLKNELNINSLEILDPTLQLNGDFWKKMIKDRKKYKGEYILLIQLNRNSNFDEIAMKFAKEKKLKLLRLCLRVDQIRLPGKHIVIPEVVDYITLINNAKYVLTDSFHAVAFSLNLNKDFYCYFPEKYSERLKSILELTNLENRVFDFNGNYKDYKIDFCEVNKLIDKKRKDAREHIERILN